jgi:hypothetical protein
MIMTPPFAALKSKVRGLDIIEPTMKLGAHKACLRVPGEVHEGPAEGIVRVEDLAVDEL